MLNIEDLNATRETFFQESHNFNGHLNTTGERVGWWLGHKFISMILLPANILEAAVCLVACGLSACTLGALKVTIFAVTLGNIKPNFSTGYIWFSDHLLQGVVNVCRNVGELGYDVGDAVYQGYRLCRWVAENLHLGNLFTTIFNEINRVFAYVAGRLEKGINQAASVEKSINFETPYPLSVLNDLTQKHRVDISSQDRHVEDIFKHYLLSVPNISLNAITSIGAAAASIGLGTIFTAKVILYATTNIDIPIPTYAAQPIGMGISTLSNVILDVGNNIADMFVLIYKIAEALGITQVVATALKVVLYIPEAIFS